LLVKIWKFVPWNDSLDEWGPNIPLEKTIRENQYLVDFIDIKYGLLSWDNGPLEE
jgi:hypothetical protein